jgi:hypothetical protein
MANAASSNVAPAALNERPQFPQAVLAHEGHDARAVLAAALARMCRQIENMHAALAHLAEPSPVKQSIPLGPG